MKHSTETTQGVLQFLETVAPVPLASQKDAHIEARLEQWQENFSTLSSKTQAILKDFSKHPKGENWLFFLMYHSHYLATLLRQETETFAKLIEKGPEEAFQNILCELAEATEKKRKQETIMKALRIAKRRAALIIALADIFRLWSLSDVTSYLSKLADICVNIAADFLLKQALHRNEVRIINKNIHAGEQLAHSGLLILAAGKLGAHELNYSSDIDLIIFYDETALEYTGRLNSSHFYRRFAQELVHLLQERTREGYVFRTDLRLRPDPASTPPAIPLKSAENYYETVGQNWERAALIKARLIAGDAKTYKYFIDVITPFIWRRSLDFASIQDIHSIKRQIDTKTGDLPKKLLGHHIKLGRGGIREIEFFVQTQQLVWGGKRPELRAPATMDALNQMKKTGMVSEKAAKDMKSAYTFYRTVEHRLQMVEDQQTHSLPNTEEAMEKFAQFMGFENAQIFVASLQKHIALVTEHSRHLFEQSPSLTNSAAGGNLVFTGTEDDPETLNTLSQMGFTDGSSIAATIRRWHHGHTRATSTIRARELLTELMPTILKALSETPEPDHAFRRFNTFLQTLPAGIQIFSLFYARPSLLTLIADIMGGFPFIAEMLGARPELLDYVLSPEFYDSLPEPSRLRQNLRKILESHHHYEDQLDELRRFAHDRHFRIGIQLIKKQLTALDVSSHLSSLAEAILLEALHLVQKEFEQEYGTIGDSHFAIVTLGKLGGKELTFSSDIDLIFIYDAPKNMEAEGKLTVNDYFARFCRRFITAVSALTQEGKVFDIDVRLRPDGQDGPIATRLDAFDRYYGTSAWAWEYMALTRARVIGDDTTFNRRVSNIITDKLSQQWPDPEATKASIIEMHKKTMLEHGTEDILNIKYAPGGLVDLEYIVQYAMLQHAHKQPEILKTSTLHSIDTLMDAGVFTEKTAGQLVSAANLYQTLLCIARFAGQDQRLPASTTEGLEHLMTHNTGISSMENLQKTLATVQKNVQILLSEYLYDRETEIH